MSTEVIKNAVRYSCDAPACRVSRITAADEPLPDGYHGSVQQVGEFGGTDIVLWFACGRNHIETAIVHALTNAGQ